jgi:hypothetical protein
MALTPNQYLNSNSAVTLRDPQHAARLFVDDKFRLLPKAKFLYHVAFNINQAALKSIELVQRHRNEINMLVKSVDLPYFTVSMETLNQYNRKKNVMTGHKYNPINIKFHDDNMGLVNQLWQNYYSYYFADPVVAGTSGAYNRTATRSSSFINNPYGLDNGSTLPFFNSITVYQMARHEYVSYTLHNPIIASWNHNPLDSSGGSAISHDNQASIAYEAVSYGSGQITTGTPEGFGVEHYDQTPSPLQGGAALQSASPSFVSGVNIQGNASEFLNTVTTQINTYQNTKELPSPGTTGVLTSAIQSATQGVSGVQGIVFPQQTTTTAATLATQINLG